jgi:hypothetical protein
VGFAEASGLEENAGALKWAAMGRGEGDSGGVLGVEAERVDGKCAADVEGGVAADEEQRGDGAAGDEGADGGGLGPVPHEAQEGGVEGRKGCELLESDGVIATGKDRELAGDGVPRRAGGLVGVEGVGEGLGEAGGADPEDGAACGLCGGDDLLKVVVGGGFAEDGGALPHGGFESGGREVGGQPVRMESGGGEGGSERNGAAAGKVDDVKVLVAAEAALVGEGWGDDGEMVREGSDGCGDLEEGVSAEDRVDLFEEFRMPVLAQADEGGVERCGDLFGRDVAGCGAEG